MTVSGGLAVDGVPPAMVMRPATLAGSAARRELQVAPPSVEVQTSPWFPLAQPEPEATPKNTSAGRAAASQADTPLAAQRLTPPTCPVQTMVQIFCRRCGPLALGRWISE